MASAFVFMAEILFWCSHHPKNIMTTIRYSRRSILVLSPDLIKSGWCDLEFQAAHQRALEDRSNFLIVVLLQEVDTKDLDETLRLYMKTRTYVSVHEKWFWKILIKLKISKMMKTIRLMVEETKLSQNYHACLSVSTHMITLDEVNL